MPGSCVDCNWKFTVMMNSHDVVLGLSSTSPAVISLIKLYSKVAIEYLSLEEGYSLVFIIILFNSNDASCGLVLRYLILEDCDIHFSVVAFLNSK